MTDAGRLPTLGNVIDTLKQLPVFVRFRSCAILIWIWSLLLDSGTSRRSVPKPLVLRPLRLSPNLTGSLLLRPYCSSHQACSWPRPSFMTSREIPRHGPGDKSFNNLLRRLHVLQSYRRLIQHVGPPPQDTSESTFAFTSSTSRHTRVLSLRPICSSLGETIPIGVFKCTSHHF